MTTTLFKLPTASGAIAVACRDEGQALILRPVAVGSADATSEEDLPWLVHQHEKPLVIDMAGVEQFDSEVARWLLHLAQVLPSKRLHMRNASRAVRAGMRLLNFDRIVDPGH